MIRDDNWPVSRFVQNRGQLTDLSSPRLMGILNVTPDSFYDGGAYEDPDQALQRARDMIEEGADIIDIGGMSSRPGAGEISIEEESRRLLPVLKKLRSEFPSLLISIDTVHGEIVRRAAGEGADWINDISAGRMDEEMLSAVADVGLPYVLMHMQGTPQTMQNDPEYEDVVGTVLEFFVQKLEQLHELGINDILLDPGFGFGKTIDHNFDLLTHLDVFRQFQHPVLAGISRKSMINKVLDISAHKALHGTGVLHFAALQNGASVLRAHDVKEARQVIALFEKYEERRLAGTSNNSIA